MWYDQAEDWVVYAWLATTFVAWLVPYMRGNSTVAWVAPLTLTAFCLGLYLGIEITAKGKFKLPITVVARQMQPIWNDYCSDRASEPARCDLLHKLLKP